MSAARSTAQVYALKAAVMAGGEALDPRTTFEPGQPFSIALTDKTSPDSSAQVSYVPVNPADAKAVPFVLLIRPAGEVLSSSYPARYPALTSAAQWLPGRTQPITDALDGTSTSSAEMTAQGRILW